MADQRTIERLSPILDQQELMAVVKAHAKANGAKWGWTHLTKCSDEQIRAVLTNCYTRKGAITEVWKKLIKAEYEKNPAPTNGGKKVYRKTIG